MKQIVCEQPDQLLLRETAKPQCQSGQALVRIKRIGICGTDMHAYKGNQPFFSYPRVLGHELAGIVDEISAEESAATGIQQGDQVSIIPYMECGSCIACRRGQTNCCTSMQVLGVHIDGGMGEWIAVRATHLIKTEGLTLDQAAVIEPLSIGAHAVRRSQLAGGETVLVVGAGPIGLGVMAFAKHAGARVIAMDINEERLAFCKAWARVDETVNALQAPKEQLAELTGGDFPTVVYDATGNARSMTEAFNYVAHSGKLVYVGLVKAELTFNDPEFHKREMTLLGSRNATREDFDNVIQALRTGRIEVDRYITHRSTFAEMLDHYEGWLNPQSKVIKAMVQL